MSKFNGFFNADDNDFHKTKKVKNVWSRKKGRPFKGASPSPVKSRLQSVTAPMKHLRCANYDSGLAVKIFNFTAATDTRKHLFNNYE